MCEIQKTDLRQKVEELLVSVKECEEKLYIIEMHMLEVENLQDTLSRSKKGRSEKLRDLFSKIDGLRNVSGNQKEE